jgi:hypothetical protein
MMDIRNVDHSGERAKQLLQFSSLKKPFFFLVEKLKAQPIRNSSDDSNFRIRSMSLLRGRGVANRMAFVAKISSLFDEAARLHEVEQPLCRDCFRKAEGLLSSRLDELQEESRRYETGLLHCDVAETSHPENSKEEEELRQEVEALKTQLQQAVQLRVTWEHRRSQAQQLLEICARARNGLGKFGLLQFSVFSVFSFLSFSGGGGEPGGADLRPLWPDGVGSPASAAAGSGGGAE